MDSLKTAWTLCATGVLLLMTDNLPAGDVSPKYQTAVPTTKRADALTPVDLRNVRVGGELGRRMDLTVNGNLLAIDVDGGFLSPFRTKNARGNNAYIGLGKTIDAMVRLACG